MSRTTVRRLLLVYFVILWAAVVFRNDRFPLTWAPMYSTFTRQQTVKIRKIDEDDLRHGFLVTHRDGSTSRVGPPDLNVPKWNFWRLYYQRAFGTGPAKHRQGNASLGTLNRWVRGLGPEEPSFTADWEWRLFRSLNETLGHEPDDPRFIVRIEAKFERLVYDPEDLVLVERYVERADLRWKEAWRSRWK